MSSAVLVEDVAAHAFEIRVYYEDTDLAGIVYYANYLKYIERARSELLRARGVDQKRLKDEDGLVFAVRRVAVDYRAPARFDDVLRVRSALRETGRARVTLDQTIWRVADGRLLTSAEVEIACLNAAGRPARLPEGVRSALQNAPAR